MTRLIVTIGLSTLLILLGVLSTTAVVGTDAPNKSVDERIAALQSGRIETLRRAVNVLETMYQSGHDVRQVFAARSELIEAQLESASRKAERLPLLKEHRDVAKADEEVALSRFRDGSGHEIDYLQAKATRLQREVTFLSEKGD